MNILVKPEVLRSLRGEFNYTLGAFSEKTKIDEALIRQWESTESEISVSQLKSMAKAFNCHWSIFLHTKRIPTIKKPKNFRRIYNSHPHQDAADIVIAYQNANRTLDHTEDLNGLELDEILRGKCSISDDPSVIASKFRSKLSVDNSKIVKSKAFKYWSEKIESLGVYISIQKLADDSVKAFNIIRGHRAIVVINKDDLYENSKVFSLLHEVGHIILGESASCDFVETTGTASRYVNQVERFCNAFAGAVLLPPEYVDKDGSLSAYVEKGVEIPDEWIKDFAARYKVSYPVVLRTLRDRGYISSPEYSKRLDDYIKLVTALKVKQRLKDKDREIRLNRTYHLNKAVNKNSPLFTKEVLRRSSANQISIGEASRYLNVTSGQLSGIKEILGYE